MKLKSFRFDLWGFVLIVSLFMVGLFIVFPLSSIFMGGFQDTQTGKLSLTNFEHFFTRRFFYSTLFRSLAVSVTTTVLAVILGATMAYLTTIYKVAGKKIIDIIVIISMISPPFIGAYSWILLAGRNGYLAQFFRNNFGVTLPSIYGFGGIVMVMALSSFPLIYLFTRGALKKANSSLSEAAESLGCNPVKKAATMIIPLIMPTVLAAALLVFTDAFTDFGTPMLLSEGYIVLPALIFREFMSELGARPNFAASLSVIMIVITAALFMLQKYIISKKSFKMSSLRPIQPTKMTGPWNVILHIFVYTVVALATIPQLFVMFNSFRATSGPMFVEGFSLDSYRRVFDSLGSAIRNTYSFGLSATVIIVILSMFIAYLSVRRPSVLTNLLDSLCMCLL